MREREREGEPEGQRDRGTERHRQKDREGGSACLVQKCNRYEISKTPRRGPVQQLILNELKVFYVLISSTQES